GEEDGGAKATGQVLGQRPSGHLEVEGGDARDAGAVEEHHRLDPQESMGGADLPDGDANPVGGGYLEVGPLNGGESGEQGRRGEGGHEAWLCPSAGPASTGSGEIPGDVSPSVILNGRTEEDGWRQRGQTRQCSTGSGSGSGRSRPPPASSSRCCAPAS